MEEIFISMEQQMSIECFIEHLFEREDIINKIDNRENLRTSDSLDGWNDFAQLYLSDWKKFLDNAHTAKPIYSWLEREYQITLKKIENESEL